MFIQYIFAASFVEGLFIENILIDFEKGSFWLQGLIIGKIRQ